MKKVLTQYVPVVIQHVPSDNIYLSSGAHVMDFQTTNEFIISTMEHCLKTLKKEKMDGGLLKCAIVNDPTLRCAKIMFEFEQRDPKE